MPAPRSQDGYAALAALLASACFAVLAAQVARTSRSGVQSVNAEAVQGRLSAAAEAGLATALDHVLADDASTRWAIDGTPYELPFGAADLQIRVEDEASKIPLNRISQDQAQSMFELAGAGPDASTALADALMAWRDPDKPHPTAGGEQPAGTQGGAFNTVQELRLLPGMTDDLYAAIAPFATVDAGDVRFEPATASPFALKVMSGSGAAGAVASIEQMREAAGEKSPFERPPSLGLMGRVLTVKVAATDAHGGRLEDATVVQITGRRDYPYIVRQHYLSEPPAG